jgi:hypothetical protein
VRGTHSSHTHTLTLALTSLLEKRARCGDDSGGSSKSGGAVKPEQALPGFLRPLARLVRRPSRDASFDELICDPPESSPHRTTYGRLGDPLPRRAGAESSSSTERIACQSHAAHSRGVSRRSSFSRPKRNARNPDVSRSWLRSTCDRIPHRRSAAQGKSAVISW